MKLAWCREHFSAHPEPILWNYSVNSCTKCSKVFEILLLFESYFGRFVVLHLIRSFVQGFNCILAYNGDPTQLTQTTNS